MVGVNLYDSRMEGALELWCERINNPSRGQRSFHRYRRKQHKNDFLCCKSADIDYAVFYSEIRWYHGHKVRPKQKA